MAKKYDSKVCGILMYVEHVLRVRVDWFTLRSINKKIGQIGDALSTKRPVIIPYSPVPDWFRQNPKLVDDLGLLLPLDRISKRSRWRRAPQNAIDITLHEVFEAMEMDAESNDDGQINVSADGGARADEVPHEVVTGSDKVLAIAQCMLEEKITEYSVDIEANKARTLYLESILVGFGMRPDGSSSSAPLLEAEDVDHALPMVHVFVQAEKDAAVEQATTANLQALQLSTVNEELQR